MENIKKAKKNFVVCGYSKSGKTTLIKRLIQETDKNVYGFFTEKFPDRLTEDGFCPIYIYPIGSDPIFNDENLIGLGGNGNHYTNSDVFDTKAVEYITTDDPNGIIFVDEVGFLEDKADLFQKKVFEVLAGDIPTVVIMKQKMNFDFMQKLKNLPNIEFLELKEDNRDEIFEQIKSAII